MSEYELPNQIQLGCSCGCNVLEILTQCEHTTITCTKCGAVLILKDGRY